MIEIHTTLPGIRNIRCTLILSLLCVLGCSLHAQSASRLIKEGNKYFEHKKYREALQYFKQGGNAGTWDGDTKLHVAICQFEINEIDDAVPLLGELIRAGKTDPLVYLYLARCYHEKNLFIQAVAYYKEFLRKYHDDSPLRAWVKDEVLRCANGISLRYAVERAYVENMGAAINSVGDDYAPSPSPNYQERLYFTSVRDGNTGGLFAADGTPDAKYGWNTSDILFAEQENGIWRSAVTLDDVLNTRFNEELYGFSADGQQMFYLRARNGSGGSLLIDTFSVASRSTGQEIQLGPFHPELNDKNLRLYNDTIILFASNRAGGYGGYDLYYAVKRKGKWRDAENLGGTINSFYDEVSPFLSRNGRNLYFSSNRLESIGGMDVFSATFNDSTAQWSPAVNLGIPINSGSNETDFVLAADGLKAFFTSDRKSGYGQRDLYAAYFKDQILEQLTLSVPVTFIQLDTGSSVVSKTQASIDSRKVREYVISDLWFEPNDVVITPQNIKKLEVLTNLLLIYPTLNLDLICHDVPAGPRSYDLFFSVKKSEQVAQYLVKKGIDVSRLFIKGCGAYYPIANNSDSPMDNPAADRLNRRIELHVWGAENQPVIISMDAPVIPENMQDLRGIEFDALQNGLVYRVQIANVGHLFQNNVFDEYADAMVEYVPSTRLYRYMIGMETKYKNAMVLRDALRNEGFTDAYVVAYVHGKQVGKDEVAKYAEQFPDLLNFGE